jgi:hypothetical protein
VTRPGFIIPNANLVAPDVQAAQPDQGDFLILGNGHYGVVVGCKLFLSFPTVSLAPDQDDTTANILICAGQAFLLTSGITTQLAQQGAQGRWDLIVFDRKNGGFRAIGGVPADNPAYPDITDTMTVLGAVSVPAAASGATPTLIDKRLFIPSTQVSDATSNSIMRTYDNNASPSRIVLNIDGQGTITWGPLTKLAATAPGVLTVTSELDATNIRADHLWVGGIEVTTAQHIVWGNTRPGSGDRIGDIYVNTDTGDISIWKTGSWNSLDTSTPAGTVIMSFVPPAQMPGWLALQGQTVDVGLAGDLPSIFPDWVNGSLITLPDMRGRMPVGGGFRDSGTPGFVNGTNPSGTLVDDHGTTSATIGIDQLPAHVHQTGNATGAGGQHRHAIPIWAPFQPQGGVVSNVGSANTNGVVIDSLTTTDLGGDHAHNLPVHNSVGGGQPLQLTPPTLSLYFYIKV